MAADGDAPTFDLDGYLTRIGVAGPLGPGLETLNTIHLAHALSIPFENLDIFLGRPIRIDLPSIQAKLVAARRGGYCFEHNTLLAAALRAIGFHVTTLGARVGTGDPRMLMRTHMILAVRTDNGDLLADVGFGAGALLQPIPLAPRGAVTHHGRTFRIAATDFGFVLQERKDDGWPDLYHFTLDEQHASDWVLANHYTSTHPDSGFVRTMTAQRNSLDAHWVLRGRELTEVRDGISTTTTIAEEDLVGTLHTVFGLDFPNGTTFRSPQESPPV